MSFFKSPESKLLEDQEIELVVAEMNAGYIDDVAFAKAFKKAKGNEDYAKSIYIEERLYRIKEIYPLQKQKEFLAQQKEQVTEQERLLALELEKLHTKQQKVEAEIKEFNLWSFLSFLFFGGLTVLLFINGETQLAVFGIIATCLSVLVFVVWDMVLQKRKQNIDEEIQRKQNIKKSGSSLLHFLVLVGIVIWLIY
jgi:hypothetical protein